MVLLSEIHLKEYYKGNLKKREIAEVLNIKECNLCDYLKYKGLKTFNSTLKELDFKNNYLRRVIRNKYSSIQSRCKGLSSDKYGHYKDMEYLTVIEFVEFCNRNKSTLETMWETYKNSGNNLKYAISIDRIDESKGYELNNIQFVTHGFNSWKSTLKRPVKIENVGKYYYFMSCAEGSRFFSLREQTIGEYLKGIRNDNEYIVTVCSVDDVLRHRKTDSIEEYYEKYIKNSKKEVKKNESRK